MNRTLARYLRSSRARLIAPIFLIFILFIGSLGYFSFRLAGEGDIISTRIEGRAKEFSLLIAAYGRFYEIHNRIMLLVVELGRKNRRETYLSAQAAMDDLRDLRDELIEKRIQVDVHAAGMNRILSEIERYIPAMSSVLEFTVFRGEYYRVDALREVLDVMTSVHRLLTAALNEDHRAFSGESHQLLLQLSAEARQILLVSVLFITPLVAASFIYIWRMVSAILAPIDRIVHLSNQVVHGKSRGAYQADVRVAMVVLEEAVRDLNQYREMRLATLQTALDSVPMAVHIVDSQGCVEYANEKLLEEWNRHRDEITGSQSLLLKNAPDGIARQLQETLKDGGSKKVEYRNDREAWKEITISAVRNDAGEVIYSIFLEVDITDRKEAEKKIVRHNQTLSRINTELKSLYDVSQTLSRSLDPKELALTVLHTLEKTGVFPFEVKGEIFLLDEGRMKLAAFFNIPEPPAETCTEIRTGRCLCGKAMATGEIVVCQGAQSDHRHTLCPAGMADHGHIIIPLKAIGNVIGLINLHTKPGTQISERLTKLFDSLGNQIGIALNNARLYEETRNSSLHDPLTGLANRRLMQNQMDKCFATAQRYGEDLSLVMIDIDHFKRYNDTRGHQEGDRLLGTLAGIILKEVRGTDHVFRYGGEEFLVLLPKTGPDVAAQVAERLRNAVASEAGVTISLGVASLKQTIAQPENLISQADEALYRAKRNGRNRVVSSL